VLSDASRLDASIGSLHGLYTGSPAAFRSGTWWISSRLPPDVRIQPCGLCPPDFASAEICVRRNMRPPDIFASAGRFLRPPDVFASAGIPPDAAHPEGSIFASAGRPPDDAHPADSFSKPLHPSILDWPHYISPLLVDSSSQGMSIFGHPTVAG
jgi:hypothetical protein